MRTHRITIEAISLPIGDLLTYNDLAILDLDILLVILVIELV